MYKRQQQDVAQQLKISQPNVSRTMARYRTTNSLKYRPRSGRPSVTTSVADRLIHRCAAIDRFVSSNSLFQELEGVSSRTVRHRLHDKY